MGLLTGLQEGLAKTVSNAIAEVGNSVKQFVTTEQDRKELEIKLKEAEGKIHSEIQQEVSKRHKYDMQSDSWLSKNVRPGLFIMSIFLTFVLSFLESSIDDFQVNEAMYNLLYVIDGGFISFYTGSRGWEKIEKIRKGNTPS